MPQHHLERLRRTEPGGQELIELGVGHVTRVIQYVQPESLPRSEVSCLGSDAAGWFG